LYWVVKKVRRVFIFIVCHINLFAVWQNLYIHLIDLFLLYKPIFLLFLDNLIFQHLSGFEINYLGGQNQHFRNLLFFAFHRAQKAAKASRDICNVYVEGVLGVSTAHKWFAKFKNGDFNLEDTPRSGRPS